LDRLNLFLQQCTPINLVLSIYLVLFTIYFFLFLSNKLDYITEMNNEIINSFYAYAG